MADSATNGKLDEERARRQKRAQLKDLNTNHAGEGVSCILLSTLPILVLIFVF